MELILPAEISGKIMTLIDQSEKELIIISPYNKFTYWKKLTQRINKAQKRGVNIRWYIRKNIENNVEQIRKIGIEPIEIENLHCKLYLNEKNAVVTSMNLHEFSDSSSIDIGYLVTEEDKYKELTDFIKTYIHNYSIEKLDVSTVSVNYKSDIKINFTEALIDFLSSLGYKKENLNTYGNRYGRCLSIKNFIENFELILEPKGSYYRIDLRINYSYKEKKQIYEVLKQTENELSEKIGFVVDFGSQMKRLKIDLQIFENYEHENWDNGEMEILKPVLLKIINTYNVYLKNAVQHYI